ncbi:hypothetical protein C8R47DRAFT_1064185 [Mycena vitilis]|nr:hypothetical protein C8R47DRAFT_1064185 [Mycena vitilis]
MLPARTSPDRPSSSRSSGKSLVSSLQSKLKSGRIYLEATNVGHFPKHCTFLADTWVVESPIYYGLYSAAPILLVTALNILFILRIHALYNRIEQRVVQAHGFILRSDPCQYSSACASLPSYLQTELLSTVKETSAIINSTFQPPSNVRWPGCVTTLCPTSLHCLAGSLAIFVSFMFFGLTMGKFVIVVRAGRRKWSLAKLRELSSYSPISVAFVQDGTVLFLLSERSSLIFFAHQILWYLVID